MKYLFVVMACLSVVGCAATGQSTAEYTPPSEKSISNKIIINADFDTVWGNLIKNLSSQYFVINNISKESRLLNVSFSSDEPDKYIDCGRAKRSFESASYPAASGIKIYPMASNNITYFTTAPAPRPPSADIVLYAPRHIIQYVKTTKLEGRTNIFVAPQGDKTELRANTRYVFTHTGNIRNLLWPVLNTSESWSVSFNSNGTGTKTLLSKDGASTVVSCVSKGKLESDILNAAN